MSITRVAAYLRQWGTNESIDSASLQATGAAPAKSILDLVIAGLFGAIDINANPFDAPQSRFLGPSFFASYASGLNVTVGAGVMMYDRIAKASYVAADHPFDASYVPVAKATSTTVTLGARDATNPRYDVIWIRPAATDAVSASRRVRPSGPGSAVVSTLYTAVQWDAEIGSTAGAPAGSPTVPTIPADAVAIARVYVPVSGTLLVDDLRNQLVLGGNLPMIPDQNLAGGAGHTAYARPVVPRAVDGDCEASVTGTTLVMDVAAGWVDIAGQRRYYGGGSVTLSAGHATLNRYDVVYLKFDTSSGLRAYVLNGTAASDPAVPTVDVGTLPICHHYMAATATSITDALIFDLRPTKPYTEDHVELDADVVRGVPTVTADLSIAIAASNDRNVTLQAREQDGSAYAGVCYFIVELWSGTSPVNISVTRPTLPELTDVGAGSFIDHTAGNQTAIVQTTSAGLAEFQITSSGSEDVWMVVRPIRYLNADDPGAVGATGVPVYVPGGPTTAFVSV